MDLFIPLRLFSRALCSPFGARRDASGKTVRGTFYAKRTNRVCFTWGTCETVFTEKTSSAFGLFGTAQSAFLSSPSAGALRGTYVPDGNLRILIAGDTEYFLHIFFFETE